jgi:hypothetical protein
MQVENSYSAWVQPELIRAISLPRLRRYEILANGDPCLTLHLYHWNSALSEALHGPLLSLEITLRNAVNERLRGEFGDAWYDNPGTAYATSNVSTSRARRRSSQSHASQRARPMLSPTSVSGSGWVSSLQSTRPICGAGTCDPYSSALPSRFFEARSAHG